MNLLGEQQAPYTKNIMKWWFLLAFIVIGGAASSKAAAQTITISGAIVLPGVNIAPSGGLTFQVSAQSGQDYFEFTTVTIPAGSNSISYSLVVPDDANAGWQVYYDCLGGCSIGGGYFRGSTYYQELAGSTDDNTAATQLQGGLNHANIDFAVLPGIEISGSVALPQGELAPAGGVELVMFSVRADSGSGGGYSFTIAEGQNSTSYTVSSATSSTDALVYYFCENCPEYLERGYYAGSGTVPFATSATPLDNSLDQAGIDLELLIGERLTGTISLPNSEVASNGDIFSWVVLGLFRADGSLEGYYNDYVGIPAGASSVDYDLSFPAVPAGGSYQLETYCFNNCGDYTTAPQFLQSDGSVAYSFDRVDEFSLPLVQNFNLSEAVSISGTLTLPNGGVVSSGSIFNSVSVLVADEFGNFTGQYSNTVEIPAGQSSANYVLDFPPQPQGSRYAVQISCFDNCGSYLTTAQYLQSDGSTSEQYFFELGIDDIPAAVDFELIQGLQVSASVALPNSDIAGVGGVQIFFGIDTYAADGTYLAGSNGNYTILEGDSSAEFDVAYSPAPVGGSYLVTSSCVTNCGNYLQYVNTFLQPDGSTSVDGGFQTRVSQVPAAVEFVLLEGKSLDTTIGLPSGQMADSGDIEVVTFVTTYDSEGNFQASSEQRGVISNGTSSTTLALSYLAAAVGGSYEMGAYCLSNCGAFATSTLYFQQDASVSFKSEKLTFVNEPMSLAFTLVGGIAIDVRGVLPTGLVSDAGIQQAEFYVGISAVDEGGDFYSTINAVLQWDLASSSSQFETIIVPQIEPTDKYVVIYYCSDEFSGDCGALTNSVLGYSSGDVATGFYQAERLGVLPASLDLSFYRGQPTSFEALRPVAEPDIGNEVYLAVSIKAYDSNDILLGDDSTFLYLAANQSFSSRDYEILQIPANGYYELEFACSTEFIEFGTSDCAAYVASDPSYSFTIQADSIPAINRLQLIELLVLQPDAYELDNDPSLANNLPASSTQQHTIHEAGDQDWLSFSLALDSDISITAVSSGSDGAARVTLLAGDAVTIIETSGEFLEDQELVNQQLSSITIPMLAAGDYYVLVQGFSDTSTSAGYTLRLTGPDNELCFPIVIKGGGVTVICL